MYMYRSDFLYRKKAGGLPLGNDLFRIGIGNVGYRIYVYCSKAL